MDEIFWIPISVIVIGALLGLILAIIIGKRAGFGKVAYRPHNLPFVMLGAALLWFGWFGFNAGSALTAGTTAAVAAVNTLAATSAACCGWLAAERVRDGHATSLGAASGIVAGLVAITPGAHSARATSRARLLEASRESSAPASSRSSRARANCSAATTAPRASSC